MVDLQTTQQLQYTDKSHVFSLLLLLLLRYTRLAAAKSCQRQHATLHLPSTDE
jgi:hypothetical protein